jgi:hypothetical protein
MRQRMIFVVGVIALIVASCSSSEPMSVEFTHPRGRGSLPFAPTGVAVDEGAVCS